MNSAAASAAAADTAPFGPDSSSMPMSRTGRPAAGAIRAGGREEPLADSRSDPGPPGAGSAVKAGTPEPRSATRLPLSTSAPAPAYESRLAMSPPRTLYRN